ncbi:MAG: hypothetical protein JWN93_3487 [Hyphomicrobiales bacterium]|nr:hypothetical protein [Hyphomicrobiales bacterium]
MLKILPLAALTAFAVLPASAAFAHVAFERTEAAPGASYRGVLRVPHGCKGEATHTVRVQLPEEMVAVKPMPKAGWSVSTRIGPYAAPYDDHGRTMLEGVREIVWAAGNLPDAHYDEFVFVGRIAPGARAGSVIYAPVVQECASGMEQWVETPAPGQAASALKAPAPSIRLVADDGRAGSPAAPAAKSWRLGDLVVSTPWTRATPRGAPVAGGYVTITNAGSQPDRLTGGAFALSGSVEVHEMSNEGGMMRMRQLRDGLEIKPGATVELKPGGNHLMFTGLRQPVVAGQKVKGALAFEKAGTIEVEFDAAPIGGAAPPTAQTGGAPATTGGPAAGPSGHHHH